MMQIADNAIAGANTGDGDRTLPEPSLLIDVEEVAAMLILKGADVNAADNQDKKVLGYADEEHYPDIYDMLVKNGAKE